MQNTTSCCIGCYGKSNAGSHCWFWGLGCFSMQKTIYSQSKTFCCVMPTVLYNEHQMSGSYKNIFYSICCGMYSRNYIENNANEESVVGNAK